jgi:hypothetical protein
MRPQVLYYFLGLWFQDEECQVARKKFKKVLHDLETVSKVTVSHFEVNLEC